METNEEYFQFYEGNKMGIKSIGDAIIVPAKYDFVSPFSDGVFMVQDGDKSSYIDTRGKLLFPFENAYESYCDFSEGLAPVYSGTKYGYIDKTGNEVIAPSFVFAEGFSEGLAVVRNEKDLQGVIDTKGKLVIDFKYVFISEFKNGYARFGDYQSFGIIDTSGNEVIEQIYPYLGDIEDGKVTVQAIEDNGEYREGVLTIATKAIEWNNNLDGVNQFNRQRDELFKKFETLIDEFYQDGCPCQRPRFRDYVQCSGNIRKIDQEALFAAFAIKLKTDDQIDYECSCGTTYVTDYKELNAFFGVHQVEISKVGVSYDEGKPVQKPIPVSLGFQGFELEGLDEIYVQQNNDEVIAYLKE